MRKLILIPLIFTALFLTGCQNGPFKDLGVTKYAGTPYFDEGIQNYDEGNYKVARRRLQFALEEGLSRPDRIKTHKYLAFIACVSSQPVACREEFGIALELDPKFELSPAEAGHPIWGPVFKTVKAKQAKQS